MNATTADAPPARLKARYFEEIRPTLIERFEYSSPMQAPLSTGAALPLALRPFHGPELVAAVWHDGRAGDAFTFA